MAFEDVMDTISETSSEKIGDLIMFAVESGSAEEIGDNIKKLFDSFENDEQIEVFQSVIQAIAGQTLEDMIEEDSSI